ncbi:MAG: IPExxxVDY family protein [Owenweeksia sp.]
MSGRKLKLDDTFYFDEVKVFGLVSDLPAYRLCYFINNSLLLQLKRCNNDKLLVHKGTPVNYTQFTYHDEVVGLQWSLIANKNPWAGQEETIPSQAYIISGLPLVASLKIIDFFLLVEGEASAKQEKEWVNTLKKMPHVRALETIDLTTTKNIHHLLPN